MPELRLLYSNPPVTGQIAYGNVYGKLFNDSKVPDVQFQGSPYAVNNTSGSILVFNVTDLDGPNQAAVTEIILTNVSYLMPRQ